MVSEFLTRYELDESNPVVDSIMHRYPHLAVPEHIQNGSIGVGVATTADQQVRRLSVLTGVYTTREYFSSIQKVSLPETSSTQLAGLFRNEKRYLHFLHSYLSDKYEHFIEDGVIVSLSDGMELYIDSWEANSIPIVAMDENGNPVGSTRLILSGSYYDMPSLHVPIDDANEQRRNCAKAEYSQFAVCQSKKNVSIALIRAAMQVSRSLDIPEWNAVIDDKVLRLMNRKYKLGLLTIGPSNWHLGSSSTPIIANIDTMVHNSSRDTITKKISAFLSGENISEFGWYMGP